MVAALKEFGFDVDGLNSDLFLNTDNVIRLGVPPLRIEIMSSISGVYSDECYENRIQDKWVDVPAQIISLDN